MDKIFTKERIIWGIITIVLIGVLVIAINTARNYQIKYSNAVINNKAYVEQLNNEKEKCNMFKITIDQLNYYNDSISAVLKKAQKELGIKDRELKQLSYLATEYSRIDTLIIKDVDTVFKNYDFSFDTIVGDKWVNTKLHMEYPSLVTVEPTVTSEKSVIVHSNRETINPPKKFFLFRWFQKKHTVIKVDVKENNPYVINQENAFYEIVK